MLFYVRGTQFTVLQRSSGKLLLSAFVWEHEGDFIIGQVSLLQMHQPQVTLISRLRYSGAGSTALRVKAL